jgi:hypothetical protein
MSRIIAAKEAEVEDMREATDGSMARLRALIEHKAKKTKLRNVGAGSLKIFTKPSTKP